MLHGRRCSCSHTGFMVRSIQNLPHPVRAGTCTRACWLLIFYVYKETTRIHWHAHARARMRARTHTHTHTHTHTQLCQDIFRIRLQHFPPSLPAIFHRSKKPKPRQLHLWNLLCSNLNIAIHCNTLSSNSLGHLVPHCGTHRFDEQQPCNQQAPARDIH